MNRRKASFVVASTALLVFAFGGSVAAEPGTNPAEMAKALTQATVSLEQGLKASQSEGTPISAKYEIEHGTLQLSVYTMKSSRYSEVIVDHRSGTIGKTETITEGADLKAAEAQSSAMAKAKITLEAAVAHAVKANVGYRAVSVEPQLVQGQPVATVVLMKGQDIKKVAEKLD